MLNRRFRLAVALACLIPAFGSTPAFSQLPDPAELMKNPRYAKNDVKPTFKKITADELRAGIKVISGRSTAIFGFNGPSVEVHLPRIDNSAYVVDKWDTPKLLDSRGRVIGFEKEQGLYDHTTFSTEIRFRSGNDKPPEFAKAIGSMTITYPLSMKTVSIKKTETARSAEFGVAFDGPKVKAYSDHVAEAAWGNELEAVRAYDKTGKRIEKVAGFSSSGFDEGGNYQQWAYHGEVARVDVDVIESRAGFRIDYEMPPVPPVPDSMAGRSSTALATVPDTPGGKFTLTPFRVIPPAALGGYASYSADEAKKSLMENYEVREVNGDALMRAAVEGNLDVVQLCLAAGVDPDVRSDDNTPLLMAATLAHVQVAKALIAAGADVNAKNQNDSTPVLQAAGRCEATELIRALLKAGANANVKALGGISPLGMAEAVKCTENAKAIKAAGGK